MQVLEELIYFAGMNPMLGLPPTHTLAEPLNHKHDPNFALLGVSSTLPARRGHSPLPAGLC